MGFEGAEDGARVGEDDYPPGGPGGPAETLGAGDEDEDEDEVVDGLTPRAVRAGVGREMELDGEREGTGRRGREVGEWAQHDATAGDGVGGESLGGGSRALRQPPSG